MKTEDLTALGLTKEQTDSVFALAGKDREKDKKTIETLTAERDDYKGRLATAEKTLEGFGGKTPEDVEREIKQYQTESSEAQKKFEAQLTARDQRDWLNGQFDKYGVTSTFARAALIAEAQAEGSGLTWKDGAYMGFDDYMKKAKEKDGSIYLTAEEREAQKEHLKKEPTIVGPTGNKTPDGKKYVPPKIF